VPPQVRMRVDSFWYGIRPQKLSRKAARLFPRAGTIDLGRWRPMGAVTAAQLCHKTAQPALSPRAALERQAPRPERSAPRKNYTQTSKPQSLAGPEELEKDNDTNRNSTVTHRSPPFIKSDFGPKTCPLNWSHIPAMGPWVDRAQGGGGGGGGNGGGRQRPETGDRRWRRAEAEAETEAGAEAEAEAEADAIHRLLAKLGPTSARWF